MILRIKLCALAPLTLLLSGCGTYLHSSRLKAETKAIKDDAGKLSAPAYLAAQQQALASFAQAEDQAVAARLVAARDYSLLNVVKPAVDMTDSRTQAQILADQIGDQMREVSGVRVLNRDQSHRAQTYPAVVATADAVIESLTRQVRLESKDYTANGGKAPTDCEKILAAPNGASTEGPALQASYAFLAKACGGIQKQRDLISDCGQGYGSGALAETCARIAAAAGKAGDDARKKALTDAMDALKKAGAAPRPAALQPVVAKWIKQAQDALDDTILSDDAKYAEVLEKLGNVFRIDLGATLDDLAAFRDSKGVKDATAELLAALRLIDAIAAATTPAGKPIDEPSALLIGIAKIKHELNMVEIDVELASRALEIDRQQAAALRNALALLARARVALCGPDPAVCPAKPSDQALAEALGHYVRALNTSMIPYRILQFREIQAQRELAVKRAALTEADYRALIQPAIDQIAQYGAGGIDPDILAPFLASLPVTGAILEK